MRKALIAASAAFICMGASANAADIYAGSTKDTPVVYHAPKSWTGLYIGLGVGAGASVSDVIIEDGVNRANFDGIGGEGAFGTIQLGYDHQLSPSLVIGGFVDYDFSNINSELNINNFSADLDLNHMWTVGLRLGVLATPDTMWYGLLGYSQAEYELSDNAGNAGFANAFDVDDFSGWTAGFGAETRLTSNWSLKAEYRFTQFDEETIFSNPNFDVDLEPSLHTGRVVLGYRINPVDRHLESAK